MNSIKQPLQQVCISFPVGTEMEKDALTTTNLIMEPSP